MSVVEEAGLRSGCGSCGRGFAASYAYYTQDSQGGQGGARNVNAVGVGVEVGRGDVEALVEEIKKVVGDDAFEEAVV